MRFMVIVKATADSEAGVMPSEQLMADMGRYNEELAKAGIMQAGEGLHPSSRGVRVRFSGASRTVQPGPFGPPDSLVAGYWLWNGSTLAMLLGSFVLMYRHNQRTNPTGRIWRSWY